MSLLNRAMGLFGTSGSANDSPDMAVKNGAMPPSLHKLRHLTQNHRFADLLPYESYDPETQIFDNDDSYGFVIEAVPATGSSEAMTRILSGMFNQLYPDGAGIQVSLWGSPGVLPMLSAWAKLRLPDEEQFNEHSAVTGKRQRNNSVYGRMARQRVDFLLNGTHQSLFEKEVFLVRNYLLLFSVTFPGRRDSAGESSMMKIRDGMMGVLKSAAFPARVLDADDLLNILDEILNFNGQQRRMPLTWDEGKLLRDQLIDGSTHLLVGRDGLVLNNYAVRASSVRAYPREWGLWGMGDLIGDLFQTALQIPCPALITAGFTIPNQDNVRRDATLKSARATYDADSPMAKWFPEWQEKKVDWAYIQKSMEEGFGLVRTYHQVITFSPLGSGPYMEQALANVFRTRGWQLQADRFLHVQSLQAALPMSLSKSMAAELEKFGRMSTRTTWNAANMVPVIGEWKGTKTPTLLLLGRRGQIQLLDFFDNDQGNFNVAIAAASGAGKSFFLNEIAASYVGTGGRAWILEAGRSMENNCRILGGEHIEFGERTHICVNPFTHIKNFDEELHMLKPLLAQMAAPKGAIDDIQYSFLEQGLRHAWNEVGQEATITSVAEWLAAHADDRAKDLAHMLLPYTREGIYRRFFEGSNTLNFDNAFIVVELGDLNAKKDLQATIVLLVLMNIQQAMYQGDRAMRKVCIIDEAWRMLGSSGHAAEFLEAGFREARKYGGSFITATQGVNDYYRTPAALAAFENADWLCLLRQKKESIEQLEKSGRLLMDGHMKRLLTSVNTRQGEYSEVMVSGPMGFSVGRLVVDPYSALLYSTQATDVARIREMERNGIALADALERLLEERVQRSRRAP